ncbi:uncharacterized protein [Prorops nasuta]|uniref:uncharacterized protein n=1 Tax=Prorops nasuta TaxID=863751 RepID=UPI0034CFF855
MKCQARGSGVPLMEKMANDDLDKYDAVYSNNVESEWSQEILYRGYSGDPWASSMMATKEESDLPLPTPRNLTKNNNYNYTQSILSNSLKHTRYKRGVVHLYNMVVCATGCNPLVYKGYGCYCGFLGSGYVIDGIDRCCKMHDWCYDATECPMFMEYFVPYYWRCYNGYRPVCAVEHGNWGAAGSCAQRLCECDRSLAECLRRYPCPTNKAVCTSSPWRLVQNLFMII